ncbi:pectinesterase family protein [Catenovulum sp. 2E275]|uniref:pectinesterase family protein n=1 Tax=Catenovulum sp. 2E275 TaxID=2980497 RepID=UPI0021CE03CE|nr:pectinesterase family protein [Catenovulum sp. 2E275]MCU4677055.1 pectinesterase family protein [Catenovulum sp. 2E275]
MLFTLLFCSACGIQNSTKSTPLVTEKTNRVADYDLLVDGHLAADDPQNNRYKTLQAAYQAAKAGTADKPTVIGIKPNVYLLTGGEYEPGLTITKNYISLVGLTQDRRKVVLADNRGLQQGASNNGFVLDVNATGFSAKNLTILNYCNIDYQYPDNPAKNLTKRSNVITQAVTLQARGDKHIYQNVQILSRLDTLFLMTKRAFFDKVYIEGTDDWVGGGDISYWQNSTFVLPTGNGVILSMNNVFKNSRFISKQGLQFYKVGFNSHLRPSVLIDSKIELAENGLASWMREQPPERPYQYSLIWDVQDQYKQAVNIADSPYAKESQKHSRILNKAELKAYNPWNLLRAVPGEQPDNWDPANVRDKYKHAETEIFRIKLLSSSPTINSKQPEYQLITGENPVILQAQVFPIYAQNPQISWFSASNLIKLNPLENNQVEVSGQNFSEQAKWVAVHAKAANGHFVTAWFYVKPALLAPPTVDQAPNISVSQHKLSLNYQLDLAGRSDQSKINWYVCRTQACDNPRLFAQNNAAIPAKQIELLPGLNGQFIKAELLPKHSRSGYGKSISAISKQPISLPNANNLSGENNPRIIRADFSNLAAQASTEFYSGLFNLTDNWQIIAVPEQTQVLGLHSVNPAKIIYQALKPATDMRLKLAFRPDKSAGQVFSVPGSPADSGDNNLHADFLIKYDALSQTGYSLRFWRTTQAADKVMFQLYKIEQGKGTPLSDQQVLSGVFKRNTQIELSVKNNQFSVTAFNSKDDQVLNLSAKIEENHFGGAGISWPRGSSAIFTLFEILY